MVFYSKDRSYLEHVKSLSTTWPHLRLLADFMEISTSPLRWPDFQNNASKAIERDKRARRTNITRLDYFDSGAVVSEEYKTPEDLRDALTGVTQEEDVDKRHGKRQLRLFVVEDLSRDVIELLGANLDIEPDFFREHIVDYAWYNVRDRWVDPPNLNMVTKGYRWLPLRFVTARYFETKASFQDGFKEAEFFNVLRRPDDDQNNNSMWDDGGAIVGITRTRASFWFKNADSQKTDEGQKMGAVGKSHTLWVGLRCIYGLL
jgi:hypothetical protein